MDDEIIYQKVDGRLVPKPENRRDPSRRYRMVNGMIVEFTEEEEHARDIEEAQWEAERPDRETKAAELRREAEEFRESIRYEPRLVAFIDVLGWADAIRKSQTDPELVKYLGVSQTILTGHAKFVAKLKTFGNVGRWPGSPEVTQFSDTIIYSTSLDEAGLSHLRSYLWFTTQSFLRHGLLVRGAVVTGDLYHRDGAVFGPALLAAYESESKHARYPRIILSPELANAWGRGASGWDGRIGQYYSEKTWRIDDTDGRTFYDFLQPMLASTHPEFGDSSLSGLGLLTYQLTKARDLAIQSLRDYSDAPRVLEKYVWFGQYINAILAEYPHVNLEPLSLPYSLERRTVEGS